MTSDGLAAPEAKRSQISTDRIAHRIREVLADAPPLTDAQRTRLRLLLSRPHRLGSSRQGIISGLR